MISHIRLFKNVFEMENVFMGNAVVIFNTQNKPQLLQACLMG